MTGGTTNNTDNPSTVAAKGQGACSYSGEVSTIEKCLMLVQPGFISDSRAKVPVFSVLQQNFSLHQISYHRQIPNLYNINPS